MFASTSRASLRTVVKQQRLPRTQRTFVSTVLLSKTYDDKTVTELRNELRKRGLAVSGPKATLITRVMQDDSKRASELLTTTPGPSQQSRSVSAAATPVAPPPVLNINIPDAAYVKPEPPVLIPFYPDMWNSSAVKAQEEQPRTPAGPKISLVAGADTYPAGGPTFNLSSAAEVELEPKESFTQESPASVKKYTGVVGQILDDLDIPHNVLSISPASNASDTSGRTHSGSRQLDSEEKRGVYVLVGLLVGSWAASSVVAPSR